MKQKILTICVPSYNMQDYLRKCVDSMLAAHVDDDLEIIIVNDGSKDHTIDIANEYKEKYPDTVVVIDKENGQYGSCVNAALKIARGKYFRIVDADDWVDSAALASFVNTLRTVDADCFVTRFVIHYTDTNNSWEREIKVPAWNKVLNISDIKIDDSHVIMHQITWRLSHLHDMKYVQSEGIYYTDIEYAFLPFLTAHTIYFCDLALYQHLQGRENQSTSRNVFCLNTAHLIKLYERAKNYEIDTNNKYACEMMKLLRLRYLRHTLATHIFHNYKNKELNQKLRHELTLLSESGITYEDIYPNSGMLTKYLHMWHKPNILNTFILSIRRSMIKWNIG